MATGMDNSRPVALGNRRRESERFGVCPTPVDATWLAEHQKVIGHGVLLDISSGGFGVRMVDAPVRGRLLHTRFALPLVNEGTSRAVEADARVCGRTPANDDTVPAWIVHLAIESMHPVDEKQLSEALRRCKAGA